MNIFDIMGPIMIGPSSSHTAGAVRIGKIARMILGEDVREARIELHGSFAETYRGHGTDRAIVAGLMLMDTDDERIPDSLEIAAERGMKYTIEPVVISGAHPNTARLFLKGEHQETEVMASSVGGGAIVVTEIDHIAVSFDGNLNTLVISHLDEPGVIHHVTSVLDAFDINIGKLECSRTERGHQAVMTIEVDQEVPAAVLSKLEKTDHVEKCILISKIV